ncbi:hypothetical protein [Micromonospora sagamiensis]|uniref:Uncharacterized protein n=1 Tax=Micromonospora sagamiensis TaxID=47875 RepID=A0A562WFD6_9ACTN|nr:hypothetical protein [Micromonospora sagamiensis]TWJ28898.1 hypothetical protein JD81_02404 [Micromonospora sagamiensis]BCL18075.1 hypothetical protein GCM10017556_58140 [Micromonospora sagamiensis]
MSTDKRADRAATDELDGTTAHEASLRPPGDSLRSTDDTGDDLDSGPVPGEGRPATTTSRAGYDVDDVSGSADPARYE